MEPLNTIQRLILKGGLQGNFSKTLSFTASVKYSDIKDLGLFYSDSSYYFSADHIHRFNRLYEMILANEIDEAWLMGVESKDTIFQELDYRVYHPRP